MVDPDNEDKSNVKPPLQGNQGAKGAQGFAILSPEEIRNRADLQMQTMRSDEIRRLAEEEADKAGLSSSERKAYIERTVFLAMRPTQDTTGEPKTRPLSVKEENIVEDALEKLKKTVDTFQSKEEQAKLLQESLTDALETLESGTLNEESRQKVSNLISAVASMGNVTVKAPDFVAQMRLPAMREGYDQRGVVAKLIQQIRKFKGDEKDYKWPQFWARYSIAVQNSAYTRHELRVIFLSCLDGSALEHYRAFLQNYSNMGYDQLVKAFKDRYDDTKEISMATLMGKAQASNEDVLTFRDRLLNDALPFRPIMPQKQAIIQTMDGKDRLIDNPDYKTQLLQYEAKVQEHEAYLTRFFVMGLREEIIARLTTTSYDTLEAAAKAAKDVEDYLRSVVLLRTHHTRVEHVNATYKGTSMPRGAQISDSSKEGDRNAGGKKDGNCFACGANGHWIRNCPYKNRSRSGSRANSRSRGSSRDRSRNDDRLISAFTTAFEKVCAVHATNDSKRGRTKSKNKGQTQQKKSRSKSKDKSKSRGHSRERHRSSSRGSRYGSRSSSRSKN
jgi:hypothetical protein